MELNFHISLPCKDLNETLQYYTEELGLEIGRSTSKWVDFNLYGTQLTFVKVEEYTFQYPFYVLEDNQLPTFHFGIILNYENWESIYDRINRWSTDTIIKTTFFEDQNGEQSSFFVQDPNNYHIEFKTFKEKGEIFM
ncbi:Bleomycin resistance protein [Tenacibaculum sp. 190130A14a]|uniref:Bleomycin resistance protein n=1 Tax=Tenacibaculum polynesiense TaxID=3137857 RepID=A0ABP1F3N8_9FLAO